MAFELTQVAKAFQDGETHRWVLRDFSFDFTQHQSVCIAGPSGSGKSTLLSLLCGLLTADAGSITFKCDDQTLELNQASAKQLREFRRDRVGFVYQFFNLIPTLTALENVLLPLQLTDKRDLQERAAQRLHTLGLGDRLNAFPDELSGGEQQRVAVARAFAHNPSVILADEPTGNLDQENALEVIDLLWRESNDVDATLIVASHDIQVQSSSDYVLKLA